MRAVLIARTKNTGIVRVMPMKSTPGWVFVVAVVVGVGVGVGVVGVAVFLGCRGCFWRITPHHDHFIAELTDVSLKTTPGMPSDSIYPCMKTV